jgi:hypothetical protein
MVRSSYDSLSQVTSVSIKAHSHWTRHASCLNGILYKDASWRVQCEQSLYKYTIWKIFGMTCDAPWRVQCECTLKTTISGCRKNWSLEVSGIRGFSGWRWSLVVVGAYVTGSIFVSSEKITFISPTLIFCQILFWRMCIHIDLKNSLSITIELRKKNNDVNTNSIILFDIISNCHHIIFMAIAKYIQDHSYNMTPINLCSTIIFSVGFAKH